MCKHFIKECNKLSIASTYCSASAHGTAVGNNRKKMFATRTVENKGTCYHIKHIPRIHW